jgi:microcystin-dependent protein
MIPTSSHNEALAGDTLYSAFLNHEWREIVLPFVIAGMEKIAAAIEDESDRQDFEVLYGAMIDDFYNEDSMDGTPVGTIVAFGNYNSVPAKWLYCNGSLVSQATYPALYALIGTIYGATSGGNFRLPELRQRMIFGALNAPSYEQGVYAGVEATSISISNLPSHSHQLPSHLHTIATGDGLGTRIDRVARSTVNSPNTQNTDTEPATNTDSVGAGASFNIMNPHLCVGYIIKALP